MAIIRPLLTTTALLALSACATAIHTPVAAPTAADGTARATAETDAALTQFFADYDAAQLALSPTSKTERGIRDADYSRWDDMSAAGREARHALDQKALADMRARFANAPLSDEARLSYRLFEYQMDARARSFAFERHTYLFNQMYGAQSRVPAFLINAHQIKNQQDAQAYIARLKAMAPLFDQIITESRIRADKATLPPRWVYAYVLSDARNIISGAPFTKGPDSALLDDFKTKVNALNLPAEQSQKLIADATDALRHQVQPAYIKLIDYVRQEQKRAGTEDGVWRHPDGAAYYSVLLNQYTTTQMSPEEIHQLGLAQVARIHSEMRALMAHMGYQGTMQAFFAKMRTDPANYLPNTAAGKADYLARVNALMTKTESRLPDYFITLPTSALQVKAVEPFREKSAGKAFYDAPTPDGSKPGIYYVNLYNMNAMPAFEMEALAFHEGLPGHHLQLSIQTEMKNLPAFRTFGDVTAYSEGWGLYAEELANDMGLYDSDLAQFGRLQLELHRAMRLVLDTGLHYKKWSREEAIAWTKANSGEPDAAITKAVERYIVMPGQATAYMIGKLKIMELRERAKAELGADFDIRAFHEAVLRPGPLPLDILDQEINRWIAAEKAKKPVPKS